MTGERKSYSKEELQNASPLALGFVGDAVHTLYVRRDAFGRSPYKNDELHKLSAAECCAAAQAAAAKRAEEILTEEELFIYKKGKNAHVNSVPKNASLVDYKFATGLETLIGYLYLLGLDDRITEIMNEIYK